MDPISHLTETQAVEQLDRLLSTQPDDSDFLPLLHWEQEHRRTIDQLQQHIMHLQRTAQDAPPQQLQPEPEETPVNPNEEKVREALAELIDVTAKANAAPDKSTFASLQQRCHAIRWKIRDKCRRYGIKEPNLPELAVNPFTTPELPVPAVPTARQREIDEENEFRQGTIQQLLDVLEPGLESPALEKAGPGPYMQPTSADILAELAQQKHHHVEEPAQADVYAHYADVSATDLDFRDRNCGAVSPHAPTAIERADRIRRDLTVLLAELDALADRQALRPALDAIWARLQMCYQVVDEGTMSEAG